MFLVNMTQGCVVVLKGQTKLLSVRNINVLIGLFHYNDYVVHQVKVELQYNLRHWDENQRSIDPTLEMPLSRVAV
jgi:hypothetical protein